MSTVHVALGVARSRSDGASGALLMDARVRAAETITSGAASVQSTLTGQDGEVWVITAVTRDTHVAFGDNPTAGSTPGFWVAIGSTREFAVGKAGEKVAVKDAL